MTVETKLSFLMTVDGYEIYIEDTQRELYEHAADNDELTDFGVWIRVLLADEDDMFDEEDDMLINATYHGKMSNFECELKKLVASKQFLKELHFDLDDTYQQQLPFSDN